ncbi:hypothetical protein CesoFtcFv8_000156 [Champsocephalus esox]|uniref:Uncharacterized protein n=1 Tax=Champsocephalus esox TaxID=159716 RepID=A0AAN8HXC8_9TELE|nr:hypothetical protein CesoFtcFv8_000156 [Champsocephalus esox]
MAIFYGHAWTLLLLLWLLAVAQHPLRLSRARPQWKMRRPPSLARTARRMLSQSPLPLPEKKEKSLLQFLEAARFNRQ